MRGSTSLDALRCPFLCSLFRRMSNIFAKFAFFVWLAFASFSFVSRFRFIEESPLSDSKACVQCRLVCHCPCTNVCLNISCICMHQCSMPFYNIKFSFAMLTNKIGFGVPFLHVKRKTYIYRPIDFYFCSAIYYNFILNLVQLTSIFSIVHFFFGEHFSSTFRSSFLL